MSLPIACTPTLRGKEAERFRKQAEANRYKRADRRSVMTAVKVFCEVIKNSKIKMIWRGDYGD